MGESYALHAGSCRAETMQHDTKKGAVTEAIGSDKIMHTFVRLLLC